MTNCIFPPVGKCGFQLMNLYFAFLSCKKKNLYVFKANTPLPMLFMAKVYIFQMFFLEFTLNSFIWDLEYFTID